VKAEIALTPEAGEIAQLATLMQFLLTFPEQWSVLIMDIAEIKQQLADVTAEVGVIKDDLAKAVTAMTGSAATIATLQEQNTTLQQQIATLQSQETVTPADLQAISDGLTAMNDGLKTAAAPLEALVNPAQPAGTGPAAATGPAAG
jgi:septal ring factor EnvC (AmiA/AmiB activator)